MNLRQLIDLSRARLDDNAQQADGSPAPNLWSDTEIIAYLNEAQREACYRARLIRDEITDDLTLIPVVAGQAVYAIDASIFEIDRVMYADNGMPVFPTSEYELDAMMAPSGAGYGYGDSGYSSSTWWRNTKQARSRYFIQETLPSEDLQLRLVPIPLEDQHVSPDDGSTLVPTQVRMTVYRYPLADMAADADTPEINQRHHIRLIDWVAKRCFERRDRDTYDPQKSADAENAFTASFGPRWNANQQRKQRERRRETAHYVEF